MVFNQSATQGSFGFNVNPNEIGCFLINKWNKNYPWTTFIQRPDHHYLLSITRFFVIRTYSLELKCYVWLIARGDKLHFRIVTGGNLDMLEHPAFKLLNTIIMNVKTRCVAVVILLTPSICHYIHKKTLKRSKYHENAQPYSCHSCFGLYNEYKRKRISIHSRG